MAELRQRRDEVTDADLVELRLDTVSDPNAAAALAGRRTPVIVTCRARWEGGGFQGPEDERLTLLADAQRLGAEFVDVEWRAEAAELIRRTHGRGIVISHHDFDLVPADLETMGRAMRGTGAEVVKLAVTVSRLSETAALLPVARALGGPTVLIAMGDAGLASRVLAAKFGSAWTYAGAVAPGQVPAGQLLRELAFRRAGASTTVYGVVGRPVLHSLSPAMHNAAFGALGHDAVYLPLAAADFDDFLTLADALGIAGASLTAPFKLDAFRRAGRSDEVSARIEAANTLRRREGGWTARNTDVAGFLAPLQARMRLQGRRVAVLGAGGAARAVAAGLADAGARVTVIARNRARAAAVAALTGAAVEPWPPVAGSWDVLVNTTPVGTAPAADESPLPAGIFDGQLVYDLVYNPPETRLLRDARAAGCDILSGLEMLVAQAELQFEWWTGTAAPPGVMKAAALSALHARGAGGTGGTRGTEGTGGTAGTRAPEAAAPEAPEAPEAP